MPLFALQETEMPQILNKDLSFKASTSVIAHADVYKASFIYDTRFDTDQGAWTQRCRSPSWFRRYGEGGRSRKREFPGVAYLTVTSTDLVIRDVTNSKLMPWFTLSKASAASDALIYHGNLQRVCALNGYIFLLASNGLYIIDLILDQVQIIDTNNSYYRNGPGIGYGNDQYWDNTHIFGPVGTYKLPSANMKTLNAAVTKMSRIDPKRGLAAPTVVSMSTDGKLCVINSDAQTDAWEIANWTDDDWDVGVAADISEDGSIVFTAGAGANSQNLYFIWPSNKHYRDGSEFGQLDVDDALTNAGQKPIIDDRTIKNVAFKGTNGLATVADARLAMYSLNVADADQSRFAVMGPNDFSGWMLGYCAASWIGAPVITRDSSVRNNTLTMTGTVTLEPVQIDCDLKAASGFSNSNYLSRAQGTDVNIGNVDFMIMFMVGSTDNTSLANQTIAEYGYYTGGNYSGCAIRIYIDANQRLRMAITDDGFTTQDTTIDSDTVRCSPRQMQHFIIARHNGRLVVWANGNVCGATNVVNAPASLANTNASWYLGRRADGVNPGTKIRLSMFRICKSIVPNSTLMGSIAVEELKLTKKNTKCYPTDNGYIDCSYDPVQDNMTIFTNDHVMVYAGLELIESYLLTDYKITGTLRHFHKVNNRLAVVTSTNVYMLFSTTRIDRFKSEYLDARGLINTMPNESMEVYTVDATEKQLNKTNIRPGTVMRVHIDWSAFSAKFIPYQVSGTVTGVYAKGEIECIISNDLAGNVTILPDTGDSNPWKFTEAHSFNEIKSDSDVTAILKLHTSGFYIAVVGKAANQLYWRIRITQIQLGIPQIAPSHVPGGNEKTQYGYVHLQQRN